jgi:hypothetical protein
VSPASAMGYAKWVLKVAEKWAGDSLRSPPDSADRSSKASPVPLRPSGLGSVGFAKLPLIAQNR